MEGVERFAGRIVELESRRQQFDLSERARMKPLHDREIRYGPREYEKYVVKVENTLVVVKKSLSSEIKQHELETTSKLVWRTSIEYQSIPHENAQFSTDALSIQDYELARRPFDELRSGSSGDRIKQMRVQVGEKFAPVIHRGLRDCKAKEMGGISNSEVYTDCQPESKSEVAFERILQEQGPANTDDNPQTFSIIFGI